MSKFDGLISLKDAANMFGKGESTLKEAIQRGKFKEGEDAKKFGKQWVFDIAALEREYGKIGTGKIITKNQCYKVAKEFCDLENDYLMGIVLNKNRDLEIKMIVPDLLKEDLVLYEYNTFKEQLNKSQLADYLYNRVKVEVN